MSDKAELERRLVEAADEHERAKDLELHPHIIRCERDRVATATLALADAIRESEGSEGRAPIQHEAIPGRGWVPPSDPDHPDYGQVVGSEGREAGDTHIDRKIRDMGRRYGKQSRDYYIGALEGAYREVEAIEQALGVEHFRLRSRLDQWAAMLDQENDHAE